MQIMKHKLQFSNLALMPCPRIQRDEDREGRRHRERKLETETEKECACQQFRDFERKIETSEIGIELEMRNFSGRCKGGNEMFSISALMNG